MLEKKDENVYSSYKRQSALKVNLDDAKKWPARPATRRLPGRDTSKEVGMKTVREIMSAEVTTLGCDDTLQLAQDIMTLGRVRHFPVLEDGEVVGVMSQRDLYKASLGSVMKYGEKAQREFLDTIAVAEMDEE